MPIMMKEQYLHLRFIDEETYEVLPFGGYTFCYIPLYQNGKSAIGVSKCSLSDNFSKKIGRMISRGRAVILSEGTLLVNGAISYQKLERIAMDIAHDDILVQEKRHGYHYEDIAISAPVTKNEIINSAS